MLILKFVIVEVRDRQEITYAHVGRLKPKLQLQFSAHRSALCVIKGWKTVSRILSSDDEARKQPFI